MKPGKLILFFLMLTSGAAAQNILPSITVKEMSGRIIVSWRNEYSAPVSTINIQRSWDSQKNYTTIGSVLNPANRENGFADANAPYDRMYYRVFIGFEDGTYILSSPVRPEPDEEKAAYGGIVYSWQAIPVSIDTANYQPSEGNSSFKLPEKKNSIPPAVRPAVKPQLPGVDSLTGKPGIPHAVKEIAPVINYVFLNKENNVSLFLPGAAEKSYSIKFKEETGRPAFQLNRLKEETLIIEKFNFIHSGWFDYEVYDGEKLLMKDKIFVAKDVYKSELKRP